MDNFVKKKLSLNYDTFKSKLYQQKIHNVENNMKYKNIINKIQTFVTNEDHHKRLIFELISYE